LKRFERRQDDPLKSWKLTDEDWRNREKRDAYEEAVEDMLARTDQPNAPWKVIAGDSKRFARVEVIETVISRIEEGLREWGMEPPPPLDEEEES
jgi:polyphosphate kinase 2 (PPK2 family)